MTAKADDERQLLMRRVKALYREASNLAEHADLLMQGSEEAKKAGRRLNAQARQREADANLMTWALGVMNEQAGMAAKADRMREIESRRSKARTEREVSQANILRRAAEDALQRLQSDLRRAKIDDVLAEFLSDASQRMTTHTSVRESILVFAELYDQSEGGSVSTTVADLRNATGLSELGVRRGLARLHGAKVIEAFTGEDARATFKLLHRRRKQKEHAA